MLKEVARQQKASGIFPLAFYIQTTRRKGKVAAAKNQDALIQFSRYSETYSTLMQSYCTNVSR